MLNSILRHPPLAALGRSQHVSAAGFFQANLELLVVVVGILGLVHDSRPDRARAAAVNLHILFGVLLWLWVIARFHRRINEAPRMQAHDVRAFARHLSRRVYLLLYGLMFLNLSCAVYAALRGAPVLPAEHFQCYLACGVLALITIHALAALRRRFLRRGGVENGRLT